MLPQNHWKIDERFSCMEGSKVLKSVVLGSRFLVVTDEWLKWVGCKRRCFCWGLWMASPISWAKARANLWPCGGGVPLGRWTKPSEQMMWGQEGCLPGRQEGTSAIPGGLGLRGSRARAIVSMGIMKRSYYRTSWCSFCFSDQIPSVSLANPDDESNFYNQCQHRDTGDHKAEREMLRQSNGAYNCLIYLHVLFCSFNSWKELEKDGKSTRSETKPQGSLSVGLSIFKNE